MNFGFYYYMVLVSKIIRDETKTSNFIFISIRLSVTNYNQGILIDILVHYY